MQLLTKIFIALFISTAIFSQCDKKKIIEPDVPKNPRQYSWTMDTLAYPESFQTSMREIWGSSANNVYVVGHNSQGSNGIMFHFNGTIWYDVKLGINHGGLIPGAIDLRAIFGFAVDDIWAVGHRYKNNPTPPPNYLRLSLIIHYDGNQWREFEVEGGNSLQDVWGYSPTDVWAGGIEGTLFHFNGTSWETIDMPQNNWFFSFSGFSENDIHAVAYEFDSLSVSTYYYMQWDGSEWKIEDKFKESHQYPDKFGINLFAVEDQLFSAGDGIFQKTSSGWERIFYEPHTYLRDIKGSSTDNLFAVGNFGAVYHFNGQDWHRFNQFASNEIHYNASWTDDKEVFIVGVGNGKSYVLHGK
ncbi:hypothetical protein H8E88_16240 [candidate division KSB1 bacterium]|nr:hypothetical protein [candidate division KSB1 bacterium]